mgnify:CR=1 FL=1
MPGRAPALLDVAEAAKRHQGEFEAAANGLLQNLAPDYARLRQGAQQCGAQLDGAFGVSAEKYRRAEQLLRMQVLACEKAQDLYDVNANLN